ncbi:MAG: recombinase family protein [Proteobacteria bacterium]|nr:recombinase family protein [Pseudomonadota bacterium]
MEHPPAKNSPTETPATRCCAIYARASVEDPSDPVLSSGLAQTEACEAFIASQKHERWLAAEFTYEDAGYSGRDLNRPALQRLLQDIESDQIQIVVVPRLDRLSRRLVDFTLLNSLFELIWKE